MNQGISSIAHQSGGGRVRVACLFLLLFTPTACDDGSTEPPGQEPEAVTWTSLDGPLLGQAVGVAVAGDASVVVALADGTLWRGSGISEIEWERINAAALQGRAWETVSHTPAGAILAAAGNALFRSEDGGRSWSQISGPPQIAHFSIAGDEILATDLETIYQSTDDGRSWTTLGSGPAGTLTVATARLGANGVVAATSTQGLRFSPDDGSTWQTSDVSLGFFNEAVAVAGAVVAAARSGTGGLLRTSDGASWRDVAPSLGGSAAFVDALVAGDDGTVYAGHLNLLLRSADGGVTWMPSATATAGRIRSVAPSASGPLAAGDDGVWRFPPAPASAERVGLPVADVTAIERTGTGTIVVGARSGVFADLLRLPSGGAWIGAGLGDFEASALAFDGTDLLAATVGAIESGTGAVLISSDRGATWDLTLGLADVPSLAVAPSGRAVAIVTESLGPEPGVHVSRDGGSSWEARGSLGTEGSPTAVGYSGSLGFLVAIRNSDESTSLRRSSDGGESWDAFGPGPPSEVLQLTVLPDETICSRTIEGGPYCRATGEWVERSEELHGAVRIMALAPGGDLWVGSTAGVFRLPAGESTWEDQTGALPEAPISALWVEEGLIIAGSEGAGAWLGTFD